MKTVKRKKLTKTEREIVYQKCNGHCAYCGCEINLNNFQVDHVIPVKPNENKMQDIDVLENMLPACRSCNFYKSTLSLEDFREELSKIPNRLSRDVCIYNIAKRYGMIEETATDIKFYFEKIGE